MNSLDGLHLFHRFILIRIYTINSFFSNLWNHIRSFILLHGLRLLIYIWSLNLHESWRETAQTKPLISYALHVREQRQTYNIPHGGIRLMKRKKTYLESHLLGYLFSWQYINGNFCLVAPNCRLVSIGPLQQGLPVSCWTSLMILPLILCNCSGLRFEAIQINSC